VKCSIWGSCVSRDVFRVLGQDACVVEYLARSSLHSRYSPALPENVLSRVPDLASKFQQRMVRNDVCKTGLTLQADCLIVDLIDERFRVLAIGNTLVTDSNEMRKSGLVTLLSARLAFARGSEQDYAGFQRSADQLARELAEASMPLILHEAYLATHLQNTNDVQPFPESQAGQNEAVNTRLQRYYRILADTCSPRMTVRVPEELTMADANHTWGAAPYHYIAPYYQYFWSELERFSTAS
jgi:hypothetical protein